MEARGVMAATDGGASNSGGHYLLLHDDIVSADDSRLSELGYKQELSRRLSALANFSVTFSIISVLTGLTTVYGTGLTYGGPLTMIWGWPIVGLFSLIVGISMAEICSAYPTSGGLYYWSAKLCGNHWGPLASWLTGWSPNQIWSKKARIFSLEDDPDIAASQLLKLREMMEIYRKTTSSSLYFEIYRKGDVAPTLPTRKIKESIHIEDEIERHPELGVVWPDVPRGVRTHRLKESQKLSRMRKNKERKKSRIYP